MSKTQCQNLVMFNTDIPSELDFTSDRFDAVKCLSSSHVTLPFPNAKTYNNLAEYHSHTFPKEGKKNKKTEKVLPRKRNYDWYYDTIGLSKVQREGIEQRKRQRDRIKRRRKKKPASLVTIPGSPLRSTKVIVCKSSYKSYWKSKFASYRKRNSSINNNNESSVNQHTAIVATKEIETSNSEENKTKMTLSMASIPREIHSIYDLRQRNLMLRALFKMKNVNINLHKLPTTCRPVYQRLKLTAISDEMRLSSDSSFTKDEKYNQNIEKENKSIKSSKNRAAQKANGDNLDKDGCLLNDFKESSKEHKKSSPFLKRNKKQTPNQQTVKKHPKSRVKAKKFEEQCIADLSVPAKCTRSSRLKSKSNTSSLSSTILSDKNLKTKAKSGKTSSKSKGPNLLDTSSVSKICKKQQSSSECTSQKEESNHLITKENKLPTVIKCSCNMTGLFQLNKCYCGYNAAKNSVMNFKIPRKKKSN